MDGAGDAVGIAVAEVASWAVATRARQTDALNATRKFFIKFFMR